MSSANILEPVWDSYLITGDLNTRRYFMRREPTFTVKFFLFMTFLMGIAITAFVISDAEYFHYLIGGPNNPHIPPRPPDPVKPPQGDLAKFVEEARKGIVLVAPLECPSGNKPCGYGTGFIVKQGYVATNAHVVKCAIKCNKFSIIDSKGNTRTGKIIGISSREGGPEDLAVLSIDDNTIVPLQLANSASYEVGHDGDTIFTIGYPLVGAASAPDKASVSNTGKISQYSRDLHMFMAQGMQINPGNSGGPVFLEKEKKVVGLVVSGVKGENISGVDYFIPVNNLKTFFKEKTGKDLDK
jgi:S1-C subfamily serine protease